jgi:hypothetical protein
MKTCEIPTELLLEEIVKRVRQECLIKMPKLDNEPFIEYNEHLREEVEYSACLLVAKECDRKFGKRRQWWKD